MDYIFTYHPAWLFVTTIVALALTVFLYYRDNLLDEVRKSIRYLLAASRFIYLWCILFLLLGIILESFDERKEKPIVFVAHDNSESILLNKDSSFYKEKYVADLTAVSQKLEEEYEVVKYSFSDGLEDGLQANYNGKQTDISSVFGSIFDRYTNRNIGAIILSTDGIYNTGSNPVYELARKNYLPVFTIGLGDTSIVRDLKIEEVKHNDIAFLGNQFPVEVVVSATQCENEKGVLGIYDGDKLIEQRELKFVSENEQKVERFTLTADKIGFRKYTARITTLDNEFSTRNNEANFYVEVIDGRQKILLSYSGPHPDINALRYVIENNKNYEVVQKKLNEVSAVKPYDLVVLHNYVAGNPVIDAALDEGTVPFLIINGTNTDTRSLSKMQIGFNGFSPQTEEVGFVFNPSFKEILINPKIVELFSAAPPLHAPFGNIRFSGAVDVLAYQKVGSIKLDNPLIYFTKKGKNKVGVIMGEGIWRWRLYDQMKNRTTKNFEEFFNKVTTFLAVKENKDPFRIKIDNEYTESDNVIVEAELYNQSFELINEPEVAFNYTDENDNTIESFFVRRGEAYRLDLGKLKAGIYNWTAMTDFQGKQYKRNGTFLVKEVKVELLNARADHRLLRNIAENSGGKFYLPNGLNQLEKDVMSREDLVTVVYQEKSFVDLIDRKWLFYLILFFIALEWFIRKYSGAY